MADPKPPRPHEMPNVGAEDLPPGATPAALDRETTTPARGPNDPPGKKPHGEPRTIDDPRGGENMPR